MFGAVILYLRLKRYLVTTSTRPNTLSKYRPCKTVTYVLDD
nr:MAG TPA: hypothetical protein [Bacteriophage sp.]DAQ68896.1 MAG TPA: hypothetical protein [Caudoviricetes sp.]